ncbi:hypothetical protein [Chromobacterium phragmitis]|uniref:hypothetical protein n=1 Tax=Chromobacterium phragmitis TaxID=2202141 RepID=UPI0011AEC1C9|nr:hypothetical protein [Chromobacterium phragmitis]
MLAWHQAISIASLAMTLWAGRLALASRRQDSEKAGILHRLETAKALFEREQQVRQELLSRNAVRAQNAWEQLKNLNSPANLRSHRACNLEIDVEEELSEHDLNLFFGSLSQAQNDTPSNPPPPAQPHNCPEDAPTTETIAKLFGVDGNTLFTPPGKASSSDN